MASEEEQERESFVLLLIRWNGWTAFGRELCMKAVKCAHCPGKKKISMNSALIDLICHD